VAEAAQQGYSIHAVLTCFSEGRVKVLILIDGETARDTTEAASSPDIPANVGRYVAREAVFVG
jgi:hypothetical protein